MLSSAVALKLGRMNEPAMTEIQAAQYLDISVRVLKERIKQGKIVCYVADGKNYLYKSDLDNYIQANQIGAPMFITSKDLEPLYKDGYSTISTRPQPVREYRQGLK